MRSITSREEVIQFLQEYNTPLLQCEFMMYISPIEDIKVSNTPDPNTDLSGFNVENSTRFISSSKTVLPEKVLLTSFDCPDSGIRWTSQQDKFGFVRASLQYSQINVNFISPVGSDSFSPIHKYYNNQFTEEGLIKASDNNFPTIIISALVDGETHWLFRCSGCRFSYPLPVIDLSNAKTSVFKTVVSYNSFRYGL